MSDQQTERRPTASHERDLRKDAEQWAQMRDLIKAKPDDWVYQADVIEAVRLLLKAGVTGAWGGLRSLVAEVDRIQTSLDKVADELGIDPRPKPKKRNAA